MEWIYFVALFFWILSALSKAKKKQAQAVQKTQAAKRVSEPPMPRATVAGVRRASEFSSLTEADIFKLFQERTSRSPVSRPARQIETLGTFDEEETEDKFAKEEEDTASHFHLGKGMTTKVSDMSNMPQGVPQMKSVGFDVYRRKEKVKPLVEMNASVLKKYFVVSEIFGKPKALRRAR
jgi:hypothetical protein